uniref:Putative isy1 splicing factor n=1 Tax=Triatoma dimidiata TaxID=72491 RepID=A0A0V0GBA2_TRIDM
MARNAEKAMTTLARWRAAQLGEGDTQKQRRPFLASECTDLPQAEKWRLQIIREIARKVSQIQNAGLGEFRIRDLNDEINKLLREKSHWEVQIKELGGPDHSKSGPKMLDHDGKEVPGNRGYKYFGAARQLPGVRELFEQAPPPPPHKTRGEMMREVDASYYGYMDDEDGLLIPLEEEQEKLAVAKAVTQWTIKKEKSLNNEQIEEEEEEPEEEEDIYKVSGGEDSEDSDSEITAKTLASFKAHVPVPTQKEVEEAILERKKQELLARFAPDFDDMEYENDNNNKDVSVNIDIADNDHNGEDEKMSEDNNVNAPS